MDTIQTSNLSSILFIAGIVVAGSAIIEEIVTAPNPQTILVTTLCPGIAPNALATQINGRTTAPIAVAILNASIYPGIAPNTDPALVDYR